MAADEWDERRWLQLLEDGGREAVFEEVAEEGFGVEGDAGEGLGVAEGGRDGDELRRREVGDGRGVGGGVGWRGGTWREEAGVAFGLHGPIIRELAADGHG